MLLSVILDTYYKYLAIEIDFVVTSGCYNYSNDKLSKELIEVTVQLLNFPYLCRVKYRNFGLK